MSFRDTIKNIDTEKVEAAFELAESLFSLGKKIFDALKSGDRRKVDVILGANLRSSITLIKKQLEAVDKFREKREGETQS